MVGVQQPAAGGHQEPLQARAVDGARVQGQGSMQRVRDRQGGCKDSGGARDAERDRAGKQRREKRENSQEFVSGSWCRTTTGGILNSSFSHVEGGSRPPLPCEEKGGGPRRGGAEKRGGLCVWLGRALLVVTRESPVPPPPPPREKNHNFEGFCSYTCPESCFLQLFL